MGLPIVGDGLFFGVFCEIGIRKRLQNGVFRASDRVPRIPPIGASIRSRRLCSRMGFAGSGAFSPAKPTPRGKAWRGR